MSKYIVALDQGTTSSRALIFDKEQNIVAVKQREFTQIYPKAGWVEHNPMEIWASQNSVMTEAISSAGIHSQDIAALGITNQRETVVVWDRETGKPIYNAIVWQCRRTAPFCEEIKKDAAMTEYIVDSTGLVVDAYFSGTKIKWILDNVEGAREKAKAGRLAFGTVDTWLIWNLTEGKVHVTDYTNASRTLIYNIHTLEWDEKILDYFGIPKSMLPSVQCSSSLFAEVNMRGKKIPLAGIAGDQQAALFGQACFTSGDIKNTYGTGCFILEHTGDKAVQSNNGLLTTIAASVANEPTQYALEGSVFIGGAVIQWLRDELGMIRDAVDTEYFANKVDDTNGAYIVPAFVGLGTPYWDSSARGTIVGLTRGVNRNHVIRAALESIAYQSADVVRAMVEDSGVEISNFKVDGGASANDFLMQFQADIIRLRRLPPHHNRDHSPRRRLPCGAPHRLLEQQKRNYQTLEPRPTVYRAHVTRSTRKTHQGLETRRYKITRLGISTSKSRNLAGLEHSFLTWSKPRHTARVTPPAPPPQTQPCLKV